VPFDTVISAISTSDPSTERKLSWRKHEIESDITIGIAQPEDIGMSVGPATLDCKSLRVHDVMETLFRIRASGEEKLDPLVPQVRKPGRIVGLRPVPAGSRVRPGRWQVESMGFTVIVMKEPVAMRVDVHIPDIVAEVFSHEVVREVGSRVGDPCPLGWYPAIEVHPRLDVRGENRKSKHHLGSPRGLGVSLSQTKGQSSREGDAPAILAERMPASLKRPAMSAKNGTGDGDAFGMSSERSQGIR
jgi:hypothetical protein